MKSSATPTAAPRVRKSARPRRRFTRRSVLKMLAVMEQSPDSSHDPVQDFLTSGRTGRRNALPDILGEHAATTTSDLPDCLEKLSTADTPAVNAAGSTAGYSACTGTSASTNPAPDGSSGGDKSSAGSSS